MPIMKFSSDEEAINLANDSNYGLGCAVFSGNQRRAREIASQLHCGVAAINDFASNYMCQVLSLFVLISSLIHMLVNFFFLEHLSNLYTGKFYLTNEDISCFSHCHLVV